MRACRETTSPGSAVPIATRNVRMPGNPGKGETPRQKSPRMTTRPADENKSERAKKSAQELGGDNTGAAKAKGDLVLGRATASASSAAVEMAGQSPHHTHGRKGRSYARSGLSANCIRPMNL